MMGSRAKTICDGFRELKLKTILNLSLFSFVINFSNARVIFIELYYEIYCSVSSLMFHPNYTYQVLIECFN